MTSVKGEWMVHFRISQKFRGFEDLKNEGTLPLKPSYDPKRCYLVLYFGAYALKEGKDRISKGLSGSLWDP
jgi:hypothetical protein